MSVEELAQFIALMPAAPPNYTRNERGTMENPTRNECERLPENHAIQDQVTENHTRNECETTENSTRNECETTENSTRNECGRLTENNYEMPDVKDEVFE